jgi:cytochrome c oxidase subunit IV
MFLNMTQVNGFEGYVGLSIGEIDCSLFNSTSNIELMSQNFTFTSNYWQRVYSSGCYYMNTKTNEWSSLGMEILADSNLTHTHCQSMHLTTFASGLNILSNASSISDVFENDSFLQSSIIFSTLFASIFLIRPVTAIVQQVSVAVITNLIVIPFNLLLLELFRMLIQGESCIKKLGK